MQWQINPTCMFAKCLPQPDNRFRIKIRHTTVTVFGSVGTAEATDKTTTTSSTVTAATAAAKTAESRDIYVALSEIGCPKI